MMTFCQQVGWAVMSWAIGRVNDGAPRQRGEPRRLAALDVDAGRAGGVGFVFSFLLWRAERGGGGHGLERPKPTAVTPNE